MVNIMCILPHTNTRTKSPSLRSSRSLLIKSQELKENWITWKKGEGKARKDGATQGDRLMHSVIFIGKAITFDFIHSNKFNIYYFSELQEMMKDGEA